MQMKSDIEEKYILAGKIASEVREASKVIVKPGATLFDIAEQLEKMIRDKGGEPAFPLNLSLNELAAHYTPYKGDETRVSEGDVIKVDIGVHVDGYIADTAHTISFSSKHDKLAEASKAALDNAVALIKPGVLLSDISTKIEETIKGFGFNPVRNLTGHGLERFHLHAEPSVPNVTFRSDYKLKEGQVIAIEPFATTGEGRVRETEPVLIFMVLEEKPARNQDARTIMRFAQQSHGLPFAERWIPIDSLFKIRFAMRELREKGALYDYAPLKEVSNGIVSQHEHTVIVKDEPIVTTK